VLLRSASVGESALSRPSIGDYVDSDDHQNTTGDKGRPRDEEGRQVGANSGEHVQGGAPQRLIITPASQQGRAAKNQRGKWQRDKEYVETQKGPCAKPIDDAPRRLRWFVWRRLDVPNKQRRHEQRPWKYKGNLDCRNDAFDCVHIHFVLQSERLVKRLR
jgi:hypothetical protein